MTNNPEFFENEPGNNVTVVYRDLTCIVANVDSIVGYNGIEPLIIESRDLNSVPVHHITLEKLALGPAYANDSYSGIVVLNSKELSLAKLRGSLSEQIIETNDKYEGLEVKISDETDTVEIYSDNGIAYKLSMKEDEDSVLLIFKNIVKIKNDTSHTAENQTAERDEDELFDFLKVFLHVMDCVEEATYEQHDEETVEKGLPADYEIDVFEHNEASGPVSPEDRLAIPELVELDFYALMNVVFGSYSDEEERRISSPEYDRKMRNTPVDREVIIAELGRRIIIDAINNGQKFYPDLTLLDPDVLAEQATLLDASEIRDAFTVAESLKQRTSYHEQGDDPITMHNLETIIRYISVQKEKRD